MWPNSAASKSTDALARSVSRVACISFSTYGMAADRALAEDDQAAGQDVGALDGDRDRHLHVRARRGSSTAPCRCPCRRRCPCASLTTCARALGEVQLGDAGQHRGLLAQVDRGRGQRARGVHHVEVAAHARQRFLDALELADRRLELRAHARVAAGRRARRASPCRSPTTAARCRGPAARHSISIRQPRPSIGWPPMTQSIGMNTSLPQFGPFWNTALSGMWRRPMSTPGCDVGISAQVMPRSSLSPTQVVGVVGAEREAEQRRDRTQRDVALVPGDAQAEHALAFVLAPADDAVVGDRRRVGAGVRVGQREARDLEALGEARQVVALLLVGAVVQRAARPARASSGTITRHRRRCRERVDSLVITCECA